MTVSMRTRAVRGASVSSSPSKVCMRCGYDLSEKTPSPKVCRHCISRVKREAQAAALDSSWREQAACRDDPHAEDWHDGNRELARLVCEGCPVREPCLEYAMTIEPPCGNQARHGIWGGLDEQERASLQYRRDNPDQPPMRSRWTIDQAREFLDAQVRLGSWTAAARELGVDRSAGQQAVRRLIEQAS